MPKIRLDDYDEDLSVSDLEFQDDFDRKRKRSKKGTKSIVYDDSATRNHQNDDGNENKEEEQ